MNKITGKFLTFIFLALLSITSFGQIKDSFETGNQLFAGKQYVQALSVYQKLLDETSDAATKAKLVFNIELTYQKLKKYDKAVETFNQIFEMEVSDQEAGGNIMQTYRNYRPSAQWEIGNSLFAKADYEGALAAYRATREKYPFKSWCGTCQASIAHKYVLYEAICLEYLKRYDEAVALYLKIDDSRLAEIYEANGQLEDLKTIIAKKDEPQIVELQKKYAWTREYIAGNLHSKQLSETIKIYELEKANNITALMNLAQQFSKGGGYGKHEVVAKMLARHPQQTVSFISSILKRDGYLPEYFYQILGLTKTTESVAILKNLAEKSYNWRDSVALVENLSLAGELGENALKELEAKQLSENMRLALQRHKDGELIDDVNKKIKFPSIPQRKLPVEF